VHVRGPESLLDHLLPRFDVRQVHEAWVAAPADVVYSAVKQVTGREVRVLMPLEFLRGLPGFLIGRRPFWPDPSAPLLAVFTVGVVPERPGREVVAGAVGRFWRTVGNEAALVRTRADFVAFSEPGYAKAAIAFTLFPEGQGTRVKTETRVVGSSAEASGFLATSSSLAGAVRRPERSHRLRHRPRCPHASGTRLCTELLAPLHRRAWCMWRGRG
jgi:hypothetical protein